MCAWVGFYLDLICLFFFFKQKTAYDIGLGIPAEPLFRSYWSYGSCDPRQQEPYDQYQENSHAKHWDYHKTPLIGRQRSEERFNRNAETEIVCRILLEKKKEATQGPVSRAQGLGHEAEDPGSQAPCSWEDGILGSWE